MSYYRIKDSLDEKEIGSTFPQCQTLVSKLDQATPNHLLNSWGKFPPDLYVPEPLLHSKAKVTDWVSVISGRFQLMSDKLKTILDSYIKEGVEFAYTELVVRGKKLPYWFMNGYEIGNANIDFEKSVIARAEVLDPNFEVLNIKTIEQLEAVIKTTELPLTVKIKKLVLRTDIVDNVFFLDRLEGKKCFVSEKVKAELQLMGCTGIVFEPVE